MSYVTWSRTFHIWRINRWKVVLYIITSISSSFLVALGRAVICSFIGFFVVFTSVYIGFFTKRISVVSFASFKLTGSVFNLTDFIWEIPYSSWFWIWGFIADVLLMSRLAKSLFTFARRSVLYPLVDMDFISCGVRLILFS